MRRLRRSGPFGLRVKIEMAVTANLPRRWLGGHRSAEDTAGKEDRTAGDRLESGGTRRSHLVLSRAELHTGFKACDTLSKLLRPSELTTVETRECVNLVVDGGAVGRKFVEQRFPDCVHVAVTRLGTEIVGVGAIKSGDHPHTNTVADESGVELPKDVDELGYVAVKPQHQQRGFAGEMVRALLSEHDGPLFATTLSEWMMRTLASVGFRAASPRVGGYRDCPCGSENNRDCGRGHF